MNADMGDQGSFESPHFRKLGNAVKRDEFMSIIDNSIVLSLGIEAHPDGPDLTTFDDHHFPRERKRRPARRRDPR